MLTFCGGSIPRRGSILDRFGSKAQPVRAPTKFEFVINLKDRDGAGPHCVSPMLLALADEVIE